MEGTSRLVNVAMHMILNQHDRDRKHTYGEAAAIAALASASACDATMRERGSSDVAVPANAER